jgi:hypothetical protein
MPRTFNSLERSIDFFITLSLFDVGFQPCTEGFLPLKAAPVSISKAVDRDIDANLVQKHRRSEDCEA